MLRAPLQIYFIRPIGWTSPIKIGCSSFVESRLDELCKWSPVPLEVLAQAPGDFALERAVHRIFSAYRFHREWFEASDRLLAGIARVQDGAPIVDAFNLVAEPHKRLGNGAVQYRPREREGAA